MERQFQLSLGICSHDLEMQSVKKQRFRCPDGRNAQWGHVFMITRPGPGNDVLKEEQSSCRLREE